MSQKVTPEQLKKWKSETLDSLYHFDRAILGYQADQRPEKIGLEPKTHWDMCRFVEGKYIEGEDTELKPFKLCMIPRNALKTSAITVGFAIQQIIKNPNIRILITNEKFDQAKKFLDEIKGHFEANEVLREVYGDYVDKSRWTKEEITVTQRTIRYKEPTIALGSLEILKTGMHYDLIIIDDWVSDENIGSKEMMDNTIKKYKLCLALLQPDGKIVVVGTRWHFNDLYNYLEKNERHQFNLFVRGAYNEDKTLFFPQKLDEKFLGNWRKSLGPYLFSCQYLNNPVDDETAQFKKSWLKFYEVTNDGYFKPQDTKDIGEIHKEPKYFQLAQMNISMAIDPSSGVSQDYTGVTVTAVDPLNRVFILEAFHKKLMPTALMKMMFDYRLKYRNLAMGMESAAMQVVLKHMIQDEMEQRNEYFYVKIFESTYVRKKEDRIRGLTGRFEFGSIFMKSDQDDLMDELLRFPVGQNDDILDSLAYQPELWTTPSEEAVDNIPEGSIAWVKRQIDEAKQKTFLIGQHKVGGYYDDSIN